MWKKLFVVLSATSFFGLQAEEDNSGYQSPLFIKPIRDKQEVVFHNRPLVKIHGRVISLLDVKKKMDFFLHERYPETRTSPSSVKYPFYTQQWRRTLEEMIENELMKIEAEELKINIPDGDVREEMENRFGPNIFKKLNDLGMSYDDAWDMVRDDIIIRNIAWYRIWARVLQLVNPEALKAGYEQYVKKNPPKEEWVYKTVTIRSPNVEEAKTMAERVHEELSKTTYDLMDGKIATLQQELKENNLHLQVSNELCVSTSDLSTDHLRVLSGLPLKSFSAPQEQTSRSDGSTVVRFFHLVDHVEAAPPPFETVSQKIQDTLMEEVATKQKEEYFSRLRKKYHAEDLTVSKLFEASYQPFSLR